MKNFLIIDGNSIINRAFYGVNPLSTKDGFPTNAVFGFINIIKKHLDALHPDYAAAAFDLSAPTFRHLQYDAYKAGRKKMPPELYAQLPLVKEFCEAAGIKVVEMEGFEADDLIGTYVTQAESRQCQSFILTGDRDSFQLISENTVVLLASNKETVEFDKKRFFETYGIPSDEFVDMKALMGDASDNIPGVAGIGEKTAAKLIAEFHNIDALYLGIDSPSIAKRTKENLIASHENAYLSRDLAQIKKDVPVIISFDDMQYHGIQPEALRKLFTQLELFSQIKRFDLMPKEEETNASFSAPVRKMTEDELLDISPTAPICILPQFDSDTLFACIDGKTAITVHPFSHEAACRFFSEFTNIYAYNSKAIYHQLLKEKIPFQNFSFDAMLAAYLLNPADNPEKPERLFLSYLGKTLSESASAADYCVLNWQLCQVLKKELESSSMLPLYQTIELPLSRTLAQMEFWGFKVDVAGLTAFSEKLEFSIKTLCERIYFEAGRQFNINSSKQLGEVLFEDLGLPVYSKTKTGYSTGAEVLKKLESLHPIISDILDYRQLSKLQSTYAQGLLRAADENGRIHTTFNQTITTTGRLSSTEPNLQNIPIKSTIGRELRRYFIPQSEEYVLIDADYSQIELRLLAHIAGDETLIEAFRSGTDIHTLTASQVFGVPKEEITPEQRRRAKAVNFGIIYGIGDFSLAADIGTSKKTAAEYIHNYLEKYPKVHQYLTDVVRQAYQDGYVTTIFNRRRYIPELKMGKKVQRAFGERVAMNSPIQGSAADIIKLAMVNIANKIEQKKYPARLILQVHDELVVECRREYAQEVAEMVRYEMEHVIPLSVPLTVDMFIADTWYK